MAEFGTNQRTAGQDANAGTINPPAKRHVARDTTAQGNKTLSSSDQGVSELGGTLATALGGMLGDKVAESQADKRLQAEMRQGSDTAINEIDAQKKRGGLAAVVFGENTEYRHVQQLAVSNNVTDTVAAELSQIDDWAASTPEEYEAHLVERKNEMRNTYEDKATQKLVDEQWIKQSRTLANQQRKASYGNTEIQGDIELQRNVAGQVNLISTKLDNAGSMEEKDALLEQYVGVLFKKTQGVPKLKYDNSVVNEMVAKLKQGDSDMFTAARVSGYLDTLQPSHRAQIDSSLAAYEERSKVTVKEIETDAYIGMSTMNSVASVTQAGDALIKTLDARLLTATSASERETIKSAKLRAIEKVKQKTMHAGVSSSINSLRTSQKTVSAIEAGDDSLGVFLDEDGTERLDPELVATLGIKPKAQAKILNKMESNRVARNMVEGSKDSLSNNGYIATDLPSKDHKAVVSYAYDVELAGGEFAYTEATGKVAGDNKEEYTKWFAENKLSSLIDRSPVPIPQIESSLYGLGQTWVDDEGGITALASASMKQAEVLHQAGGTKSMREYLSPENFGKWRQVQKALPYSGSMEEAMKSVWMQNEALDKSSASFAAQNTPGFQEESIHTLDSVAMELGVVDEGMLWDSVQDTSYEYTQLAGMVNGRMTVLMTENPKMTSEQAGAIAASEMTKSVLVYGGNVYNKDVVRQKMGLGEGSVKEAFTHVTSNLFEADDRADDAVITNATTTGVYMLPVDENGQATTSSAIFVTYEEIGGEYRVEQKRMIMEKQAFDKAQGDILSGAVNPLSTY